MAQNTKSPTPSASPVGSHRWAKPLRFGVLGALGCVAAAILGEGWLFLMRPAPPPPPPPPPPKPPAQAVALVLDTSFSMSDGSLDSMVQAAKEYVRAQDLTRDRTAIVHFGSQAELSAPLSHDRTTLETALDSLSASGTTNMGQGLRYGMQALQNATEQRSVLLFTDGSPDDADDTLQAASTLHANNIQIVAVATDDADTDFLAQVTGDPSKVIPAHAGAFTPAFQQAQKLIYGYDLTSSAPVQNDTRSSGTVMLVVAIWTALLGLGVSLALVWGQAAYYHRPLFEVGYAGREIAGLLGGAGAGLAAGAAAQYLFVAMGAGDWSRIIAWAMLGGVLGCGMALFVPNLNANRAWQFGALGGGIAAFGFRLLSAAGSDVAGRLAGALLLGFFIGLLVALAEEAFRRAWLHVEGRGASEVRFDVNLGAELIAVGSDRTRCLVYAPGAASVAGRFGLENGRAFFQTGEAAREWLAPGDVREFGEISVTLNQPRSELAGVQMLAPNGAPLIPYAPPVRSNTGQHSTWINTPAAPPVPSIPAIPPVSSSPPLPPFMPPVPPMPTPFTAAPPAPVTATQWRLHNLSQTVMVAVEQSLQVGRLPDNDICVPDGTVSSRHAQLECEPRGILVTDLDSTNGTWVNGVQIPANTPHLLRDGDRLRLGAFEWWVRPVR